MKQEQPTSCLYFCMRYCIGAFSPLLADFAVQTISSVAMSVSKYRQVSFLSEYGCPWHQLWTLLKNLGRRGWRDYWHFLTSLCCPHCPTVLIWISSQPNNIYCKVAWLPGLEYLQACWLASIGQPFGLSNSKNNNKQQ